jgi:hypothetical protein
MANRILTADKWQQRIRDKLGIDAAYLPDSTIEQPDYITLAEANIIEQIPDYASITGDLRVFLEAAVVCECAALLCPSMPVRLPAKEQGPHESHTLYVDWTKVRTDLEVERDKHTSKIFDVVSPIPRIQHFSVTRPVRGW